MPRFTFSVPEGDYWFFRVVAIDRNGLAGGFSNEVIRLSSPTALLVANPLSGPKPLTVTFDAGASFDPDGNIVSFEWDFTGDGAYEFNSGPVSTVEFTYEEVGDYLPSVRIVDDDGLSSNADVSVRVYEPLRGDWWMFGKDARHSGRSSFVGPHIGDLRWSNDDFVFAPSPTVGQDGTIYVGGETLVALSMSGEVKWSVETEEKRWITSPAIGKDGTIYAADANYFGGETGNYLTAFSSEGSIKWRVDVEGKPSGNVAIGHDGTIYLGTEAGYLYAVTEAGVLKWTYQAMGSIRSSPAVTEEGMVVFGCDGDFSVYALTPDGELMWRYETRSRISSSPAVTRNGVVYIGGEDGYIYAINPDGTLRWKYEAQGFFFYGSPAIGSDASVYMGAMDSRLYALNGDGALTWKFQAEGPIASTPAIGADAVVYFVGSGPMLGVEPTVYACSAEGTLLWSAKVPGWVSIGGLAIGEDGSLYIVVNAVVRAFSN